MKYLEELDTKVSGIPCLIGVISYFNQKPDYSTWASDMDYYGYTEVEYDILDRRGRKADWLERKMTDKDRERIEEEVTAYMEDR